MQISNEAMVRRYLVGESHEVTERGRLVVDVAGVSIGVFRLDGALHAYENICAHQGGPVCQGLLVPRVNECLDDTLTSIGMDFDKGELNIVCPWHGFEYSLRTGEHPGKRDLKLRPIPVSEEDGHIYVTF
jgi:nitrite reductase/ring-hydroxylating ferredoxin subunit